MRNGVRGVRARLGLWWVCLLASSCAPSKFDDLTESEPSRPRCDGGTCPDASLDAAVPGEAGPEPEPPACDAAALVCVAAEQDQEVEACGHCEKGVRTRTRPCTAGCWGAWSAWSECAYAAEVCDPAETAETRSVDCPTCGSKQQRRTCMAASCTWSAWEDTSRCTWCEQCSRIVFCDTPDEHAANRGTWCVQEGCSREQADDDCEEDVLDRCGAFVEPFFMEYM
jgi:hypothetical protein